MLGHLDGLVAQHGLHGTHGTVVALFDQHVEECPRAATAQGVATFVEGVEAEHSEGSLGGDERGAERLVRL